MMTSPSTPLQAYWATTSSTAEVGTMADAVLVTTNAADDD
jgi:hypothetical protein